MPHHTPLISTIVVGLVLAFAFGALAQRVRVSPLVGYLLADVAMGPFTPGYVADQKLANELAERARLAPENTELSSPAFAGDDRKEALARTRPCRHP
jgi:hypothetical protein